MTPPQDVTLTVDGKEVTVPAGTLIIRAAEQLGIEIPRFCDHPYLEPAGSCRQCYVEVEGQRKLMTSCTTPVGPNMVVKTQNSSDQAHEAQVANLEFLLLNHPLDCPICDRGGECPLQDQALAFGPGETRYEEAKRVYEKPLYLSPLVALDRERCVLCARCTRFCDQISGDRFIELFERGAAEQVAIAPGEDFRSPFSGNTIQICPVGALTSVPYRFAARPFDLKSADSVCNHCSAGCNIRVDLRRGEVVRHLARDNPDVNDLWTCDKGRFAFQFPDSADRLTTPLLRDPGLTPVSFGEAFHAIARIARPGRVGILAGGRLTDEDAYALSKLARVGFGTNDLDHRRYRTDDVPVLVEAHQAAGMRVTNADVENAKVILLVGLDAEQEVPILHLRIRKAAARGAKVFVIHPRRTRLHDVARHLPTAPGQEAETLSLMIGGDGQREGARYVTDDVAEALQEATGAVVVLAGERVGEAPGAVAQAVAVAVQYGGTFGLVPRRAADRGALRAGVHPALLPGGRRVDNDSERAEVEAVWGSGSVPSAPGRNAAAILQAAANHEIDVLYLIGVDPLRDFPDAALAVRALENVELKVVQDVVAGPMAPYADVMLPASPWIERDGEHVTNWEGRSQRLHAVRGPMAMSRPDWQILQELSGALGHDLGFGSLERLQLERASLLGAERDVDLSGLGRSSTGAALGGAGNGLLLFTYPLLVDEGTLARQATALKEALGEPAFLEVHPSDAQRLGLSDGGTANVRTPAGGVDGLPVRVTEDVAVGAAFVPFNNPGLAANTLLSGRFTAMATVTAAGGAKGVGLSMDWLDWILLIVRVLVVFAGLLVTVMVVIWMERKVLADMQNRIGPNRAGPFGLLITLADGIKLFFKEGVRPLNIDRPVYVLAPVLALIPAFLAFSVIPFGTGVTLFGRFIPFQLANLDIGILWVMAMTSVAVYGIVLAGWSSGSKYPLLGAIRSSSQVISYEVGMGLALVAVIMYSGTLSMSGIVAAQDNLWNIVPQAPAFVVYLIAALAEINRPPFDLPEAETELVAGYQTEYSGIKFALFYLAEYLNMVTVSAIAVTLFLGGPRGPWIDDVPALSIVWFLLKVFAIAYFYIWVRATLPRFRYDRLMNLGWKVLIPFGLIWILFTGAVVVLPAEYGKRPFLIGAGIVIGVLLVIASVWPTSADPAKREERAKEAA